MESSLKAHLEFIEMITDHNWEGSFTSFRLSIENDIQKISFELWLIFECRIFCDGLQLKLGIFIYNKYVYSMYKFQFYEF